ncbi:hypothetical protein M5K25_019999 [Dendrobium thyrsiflorum]|uniref:Uncharacterized protein n=1 Tax=Dendrobium thyrsiflorum TaxID=117978 RepID=A0ABD0UFT3_DENTH
MRQLEALTTEVQRLSVQGRREFNRDRTNPPQQPMPREDEPANRPMFRRGVNPVRNPRRTPGFQQEASESEEEFPRYQRVLLRWRQLDPGIGVPGEQVVSRQDQYRQIGRDPGFASVGESAGEEIVLQLNLSEIGKAKEASQDGSIKSKEQGIWSCVSEGAEVTLIGSELKSREVLETILGAGSSNEVATTDCLEQPTRAHQDGPKLQQVIPPAAAAAASGAGWHSCLDIEERNHLLVILLIWPCWLHLFLSLSTFLLFLSIIFRIPNGQRHANLLPPSTLCLRCEEPNLNPEKDSFLCFIPSRSRLSWHALADSPKLAQQSRMKVL